MKKGEKWTAGQKMTCGILLAIPMVFFLLLFLSIMNMARTKSAQTDCASNQKQIALAIQMYAQEHNDIMPSTAGFWGAVTANGVNGKILHCPKDKKRVKNSYGQNSSINGLKLEDIINPEDIFLTAEATPESKNILSFNNGAPRHAGKIIASYVDGHVAQSKSPIIFVHANTKLAKDLSNQENYTPDGKYNSAHWNLSKISGNQKVLKKDKHSKLVYDEVSDTVTLSAIGKKASAVAKVDLPAFYPEGVDEASKYWVFSANISFEKSINAKSPVNVAIIFLDEQEKVIAAFSVLCMSKENISRELITLHYNNNVTSPQFEDEIMAPTISLHDAVRDFTGDQYDNVTYGRPYSGLARFTTLSIAAHKDTLYVQYGNSYEFSSQAKIDPTKTNWKKPTTLKIVCFENDLDSATKAIELQSPRFAIK